MERKESLQSLNVLNTQKHPWLFLSHMSDAPRSYGELAHQPIAAVHTARRWWLSSQHRAPLERGGGREVDTMAAHTVSGGEEEIGRYRSGVVCDRTDRRVESCLFRT